MYLLAWHNMEQRDYQDKTILIDNITNRVMFNFKDKTSNDLSWSDNILEVTSNHKDINVCCSGGLDSDIMLRLFHKHRNVKCFIGRWMDNGVCYNDYDIQYAVQTCEELDISYQFIDVNFANFFDNGEFISYGTAYKCTSPQLCLHLKMFDIIGEDVAIGGNFFIPRMAPGPQPDIPQLIPENNSMVYDLFFSDKGCDLGNLHYYNTSLALCTYKTIKHIHLNMQDKAYLEYDKLQQTVLFDVLKANDKIVTEYKEGKKLDDAVLNKLGSKSPGAYLRIIMNYIKRQHYYSAGGFEVVAKSNKYTGFEGVKRYYVDKYNEQQDVFDNRFRKHLEKIVSIPTLEIDIINEYKKLGEKEWQNS